MWHYLPLSDFSVPLFWSSLVTYISPAPLSLLSLFLEMPFSVHAHTPSHVCLEDAYAVICPSLIKIVASSAPHVRMCAGCVLSLRITILFGFGEYLAQHYFSST